MKTGIQRPARAAALFLALAAAIIVPILALAVTWRPADSATVDCSSTTSLEIVGTGDTPANQAMDLTAGYSGAETSIRALSSPAAISVLTPLDIDPISVTVSACAIEYVTDVSVAISATATNILPGGDSGETADLLVLATWPGGPMGDPVVSLGGHVDGDFDLTRIHSAFQTPEGLTPEFQGVWFSQSSGEQTGAGGYAGAGAFYPSGHDVPAGVAFRGEVQVASIIGDVLAGYLGGTTVSIFGGVPVQGEATIYNDTMVVVNTFTLAGEITISGGSGLPEGVSLPSHTWRLELELSPIANNDRGNLKSFGVQASLEGEMAVDGSLLGTPLVLGVMAEFEWDSASETVVILLVGAAAGPWNDLFGMEGFSADEIEVGLRWMPGATSATVWVRGEFTANSFQFALTFAVSYKGGKFNAAVTAEALSDITMETLIGALANLDQMNQVGITADDAWAELDGITLTGLKARLSFGQSGVKVFVHAGATVFGLETSIAFYLGPDTPAPKEEDEGGGATPTPTPTPTGTPAPAKYGFMLGLYVAEADLGDLIPGLPSLLDMTVPQTIFYVGNLKLDADINGFPDRDLFKFFNEVYGTTEDPGAKITVLPGAGLLTNISTPPLPEAVKDALEDMLYMDLDQDLSFQGNVPLFGRSDAVSLFLYLPEVVPGEGDQAPEWFERAALHVSITIERTELEFKLQGELDIRLRKPDAPEPLSFGQINPADYNHFKFLASGIFKMVVQPPSVSVSLTGEMRAPEGWHPLGWENLTVEQLAGVLEMGTTSGGNLKISLGLGGAFVLGSGDDRLDLEASFLVGVQTVQYFPWVTANIDGFRIQSNRGLKSTDLLTLAEFATASVPDAVEFQQNVRDAVEASLPEIAVRDLEITFAKVDNVPLCLQMGFKIKGFLYVNPSSDPPYVQRPPCDSNYQPGCDKADGCIGGVDIEVVLTPQQPPKVAAKAVLNPFDIGPIIHIGPAEFDFEIRQAAVHLIVNGQMRIGDAACTPNPGGGCVAYGLVALKFLPNSYDLTAEAKLFDAFWAYLDAHMDVVPPSFRAHGELKAEFGTALATALEDETENLRALLMTLRGLYRDFTNTNTTLTQLTDSLIALPVTLRDNGASGPLIDLMATFAYQVQLAMDAAHSAGLYPNLDQVVNTILQGATITITEGVPGEWVDGYCIGYINRKETCVGVWVSGHCRLFNVNGTCWIVPPITFHIPGICPAIINLDAYGGCNSTGLKNLAAEAVDAAFQAIFGRDLDEVLARLDEMLANTGALFDLNCAAFDINLSSEPGDQSLDLFLGITLLGRGVVWEGNWDFSKRVADNIGNNRQYLMSFLQNIFQQGAPPDVYRECTRTGPPSGGPTGIPKDLAITAPSPVNEGQSFTLHATFTEAGVQGGDTRTYSIAWGDGTTSGGTLSTGQTAFDVAHTYADDPVGSNDNRQVSVTVANSRAGSTTGTATVRVNNVNPTAGTPTLSASSVSEGQVVTVTGSLTDPGTADTHTVTVTWNDGSQPTAAVVDQQTHTYSAQHTYVDDNPTGTAQDTVQLSVQARDDDGGAGQVTATLEVRNVAPLASALTVTPEPAPVVLALPLSVQAPSEFFEGDQFVVAGEFSDPGGLDSHTVKVEWRATGDWQEFAYFGLPFQERSFSVTLPLPDDDPTGTPEDQVTVRVTLEDDDSGAYSQEFPIVLKNRDPEDVIVTPDRGSIDEDGTIGVTVQWEDAGIADEHVVVIDWGDGQQTVVSGIEVSEREAGASHHYPDEDPTGTPSDIYVISATVTDDDTGSGAGAATLTVINLPPVATIGDITDENGAVIGVDVAVAVMATRVSLAGSFTDTGTLDTHTATIDWGDGTVDDLGPVSGGISASHIYWLQCTCTITLTITDDDTGVGQTTRDIRVVDASGAVNAVIDALLPLGGDPQVAAAINKLRGDNGGTDANGALDMLEKGNLGAALEKIKQALLLLEASPSSAALVHEKGLLALAGKSVAVIATREAGMVASSPKDIAKVATAAALIIQGDGLRLTGNFVGAVGKYLEAVRQVQGML